MSKKILAVDDESDAREIISFLLLLKSLGLIPS